jgi:hypothetical protein
MRTSPGWPQPQHANHPSPLAPPRETSAEPTYAAAD